MLSLSCDSLSTKQQYMSQRVIPAESWGRFNKTVGDSVDDSVRNPARLAVPPQKKSPDRLSLAGAPMLPFSDQRHRQSRSHSFRQGSALETRIGESQSTGDRTQSPQLGS